MKEKSKPMKFSRMFVGILAALTLNSCVVYGPQTADIPLIHGKNDFRFDGGIALMKPSLNSTLSYGLTNKLAVQAYGNLTIEKDYYFHGALGYYKKLKESLVLEVYGGAGYGYGYTDLHSTGGSLFGNYTLPFIQLNIGKLASETTNFEYGAGIKGGFLQSNFTEELFDAVNPQFESKGMLIEPTVFLRPGGKKGKVNFKLSSVWISNLSSNRMRFPHRRVNLGISLNLR